MKKLKNALIPGAMAIGILAAGALAAEEMPAPSFAPVEIYTCNYLKGKGRADLDRVVGAWNKWMDEGQASYSAWTLTPNYFGPDFNFDVGWLGAWPDGATMGADSDRWAREGGKHAAAFFSVIECDSHANFASMQIKAPGPEFPGDGIATFEDCKVAEGHTMAEAMDAHRKWAAYQTDIGSKAGMWIYFPAYAGGDVDFDYKVVSGYANYADVGADYDRYGNGGGYRKAGEIFGGIVECNSARLYDAKLERKGMMPAR